MTVDDPYRNVGERPKLSDGERRYFTKSGDVVKGPFDADALADAVKRGMVRGTTLARGEDETEWKPIADVVRRFEPREIAIAPHAYDRKLALAAYNGSFALGFAVGLFGGLIGAIVVQAQSSGSNTRRGAWFGFLAQALIGTLALVIRTTSHL